MFVLFSQHNRESIQVMASIQKLNDCKDVLNELSVELSSRQMVKKRKPVSSFSVRTLVDRVRSKSKEDHKPLFNDKKVVSAVRLQSASHFKQFP